jgi:osmoprotectant transport system permease protein
VTAARLQAWAKPVALAAAAVAVVAYAQAGAVGAREAEVLSGDNLAARAGEHLRLSLAATALAVAVAVPAGVVTTRRSLAAARRPVMAVANLGQTVPTLAVLALLFTYTGVGFRTALLALWLYSLLPVLRNTMAGLASVDPAVAEAARGMGMSPAQVLLKVEFPLAAPVILAGIRTAAVTNVGTAALATFVGAGGLGAVIDVGITSQRDRVLFAGAALTALLALAVDWAVAGLGRVYDAARLTRSSSAAP